MLGRHANGQYGGLESEVGMRESNDSAHLRSPLHCSIWRLVITGCITFIDIAHIPKCDEHSPLEISRASLESEGYIDERRRLHVVVDILRRSGLQPVECCWRRLHCDVRNGARAAGLGSVLSLRQRYASRANQLQFKKNGPGVSVAGSGAVGRTSDPYGSKPVDRAAFANTALGP